MKDLKVTEWIEFAQGAIVGEVERLPESVKSAELKDVAQAFAKNCLRFFRLIQLPGQLYDAGKHDQHTTDRKHVESTQATLTGQVYTSNAGTPGSPVVTHGRPFLPTNHTPVQRALEGLGKAWRPRCL